MTAHAMSGDEEKSLQAGMNGHVTKPIDPDPLFAALMRWIRPPQIQESSRIPDASTVSEPTDKAAGTESEMPQSIAGFNLAEGLKRLQGNQKLYRKLLLNFASDYRGVTKDIRHALDAEDFETAHRIVHTIKGVAGNLAATDLQAAAKNFEQLIKGVDQKNLPSGQLSLNLTELETSLKQAFESIQRLNISAEKKVGKMTDNDMATIPAGVAREIANRIRDAAEMGDLTALNAIAEELKDQSESCRPVAVQIGQMAGDIDFESILKLADDLEVEK
jgi:HPt (histidine-containing phosphotransfer) domain-containing protein